MRGARRFTGALAAGALLAFLSACSSKPAPVTGGAGQGAVAPPPAGTQGTEPEPVRVGGGESVTVETLPMNEEELNRQGYLKDVFFGLDSYDIGPDQREALAQDAAWLKKWPTVKLSVEGHCDERGTARYNMALGERRAQSVKDYLGSFGIDPSRVQIVSYGKERPFVDGHDERAWAQNRRAHFVITAR